ncbi:MAG: DUF5686 and carboxypeptidase regulatory-like domain-containing protein [Bacteroidetes bacterium]|nr:DUF5686 and carboxypeptidase regulatory-like domain-containing protein [Bacteroidota bacterium]
MIRLLITAFLVFIQFSLFGQKTIVSGKVTDAASGELLPFVKVQFQNAKIGALTDDSGRYYLETYYATDSLVFFSSGYKRQTLKVSLDVTQTIDVKLSLLVTDIQEMVVRPPDEFPSTILHKKMVANKRINDREKLDAFEYELYNKLQLDLNNIGDKFSERKVLKPLDFVLDYLDSSDGQKTFLPVLLSESISDFYFKKDPKRKVEVSKGYQVSGTEDLSFNQFLGDMYLDINVYDNYIQMFGKAFISPTATIARSFYKFYLEDSTFIDNQWCFKLRFLPKRTGDLTFVGEMWIHDTTYAIKLFKANIAPDANINFIQDMYFEHKFDMVQPEVWMLTEERTIADINVTENSKLYGLYGRKYSSRKNFVINKERPVEFYRTDEPVITQIGAGARNEEWWAENRHRTLTEKELKIEEMVDSLNNNPYFNRLKNVTYLLTTGYYPIGKIEIGSVFSLFSTNPIEKFRGALALRTSNSFSKRIELGGRVAYGILDNRFKYNGLIRLHLSQHKRALLSLYYNNDIDQLGQPTGGTAVGSTFGTVLRTGPLDKLSFVYKVGAKIEKDVKKDLIFSTGAELREISALGRANFVKRGAEGQTMDTVGSLRTFEVTTGFRWAKGEEFLTGAFDRVSIKSRFPIFKVQATFGVKGVAGSQYQYQRLDVFMDHNTTTGIFGHILYGANAGKYFGNVAYPFLKIHEGNQSYYLITNSFNKLGFYEFISDEYVTGYVEQHWDGFILDRIPLIKKLKWRAVSGGRGTIGRISKNQSSDIVIPSFTRNFKNTPYLEANVGIENIFKVFRVDLVWRLTHLDPGMNPLGVRVRFAINL